MKLVGTVPSHQGFWTEDPCYACQEPLCTTDPQQRLCAECSWLQLKHITELVGAANGDNWVATSPLDCYVVLWQLWPEECTT